MLAEFPAGLAQRLFGIERLHLVTSLGDEFDVL